MKVQRNYRSGRIGGLSHRDFMKRRDEYINDVLDMMNSYGVTVIKIDDEPVIRGISGNVYGYVNFLWETDTENPDYKEFLKQIEPSNGRKSSGGTGGQSMSTAVICGILFVLFLLACLIFGLE